MGLKLKICLWQGRTSAVVNGLEINYTSIRSSDFLLDHTALWGKAGSGKWASTCSVAILDYIEWLG